MANVVRLTDLEVYRKAIDVAIIVSEMTKAFPTEE